MAHMFVTIRRGFTLIELIIVIAVLAVLAAVAIPGYQAYEERARQGADIQNASVIASAINVYNAAKSDRIATAGDAKTALCAAQMWPDIDAERESDAVKRVIVADHVAYVNTSNPYEALDSVFSDFSDKIANSLITTEFYDKKTAWSFGSGSKYDMSSWSGYLEKLLEKGEGSVQRDTSDEGTNTLGLTNPYSGKQGVFNWNNWDSIKSGSYSTHMPPAIIITNDPHLAYCEDNTYIHDNADTLKGAMVIYKANDASNDAAVVYYVKEDGSLSDPQSISNIIK